MTRVLAAVDTSIAAQPVLSTASALAPLFGAEVEAVHVRVDGERIAQGAADQAGLELIELEGSVVETLVAAASPDDVALAVLGVRATPGGARPAGSTAISVATSLAKPVVLVPPEAAHPGRMRKILVPLEGSLSTSLAPRAVIDLAREPGVEVLALHVLDEASLPAFTDQPQHEADAWAREFLERYCPSGVGEVRCEIRVGDREELIPQVARETDADLIALGWSSTLAANRAPVVRAALEHGHVPVMLFPVVQSSRRETFATLQSSRA
jgi:nucleotide-binding universal stress UspA family protein